MIESLRVVLQYSQAGGIIGSRKIEETGTGIYMETVNRDYSYYYGQFEKDLKTALNAFSRKSIYDVRVEVNYYVSGDYREKGAFLLLQEYGDKETGVYTLYDYTDPTADRAEIKKVSKSYALKTMTDYVKQVIKSNATE